MYIQISDECEVELYSNDLSVVPMGRGQWWVNYNHIKFENCRYSNEHVKAKFKFLNSQMVDEH